MTDDYNQIYSEKDLINQYEKGLLDAKSQATKEILEKIDYILLEFELLKGDERHTDSFKDGIGMGILRLEELKQQLKKLGDGNNNQRKKDEDLKVGKSSGNTILNRGRQLQPEKTINELNHADNPRGIILKNQDFDESPKDLKEKKQ